MKELSYTDSLGRLQFVLLPEGAGDPAEGIPSGVPDLEGLGLPPEQHTALHNALAHAKLFDWRDVMRAQSAVTDLVRRLALTCKWSEEAAATIRRELLRLYRARR